MTVQLFNLSSHNSTTLLVYIMTYLFCLLARILRIHQNSSTMTKSVSAIAATTPPINPSNIAGLLELADTTVVLNTVNKGVVTFSGSVVVVTGSIVVAGTAASSGIQNQLNILYQFFNYFQS